MVPGYKVILFTSFSASMYMMTRMLLVRRFLLVARDPVTDGNSRDTRLGGERIRVRTKMMVSDWERHGRIFRLFKCKKQSTNLLP